MSDADAFEQAAHQAIARMRAHVDANRRGDTPATGYAPMREVLKELDIVGWMDRGGMDAAAFDRFLDGYLRYSVQFHHPGYIAHQVAVPDYPAALGTIVNGLTHNPMAIYEMGPAAATLEFAVVNWMLGKVGWTPQPLPDETAIPHAGGVLTHGGSLANLTCLLAARARIAPDAWTKGTPPDLAVLAPDCSHYSIGRAVAILGLGADALYPIETTDLGVIRPEKLSDALARVENDGRRCMAVVANACATATGLHDPLDAIGEFCNEHGIWLHADACHGATALLAEHSQRYLDGIERADSVVWDTHKMMQVPVLCAAALLKDAEDFARAFHQDASYLAYGQDSGGYDSLPRAIECTKAAMGLKVFLNLAWRGEKALGDYVDGRYAAARRFYDLIRQRDGFECPYEPEANILCFRYGDDDGLQEKIRDTLLRRKRFQLTSAEVNGRRYLRMTVMNTNTDDDTILAMLDAIEAVAADA